VAIPVICFSILVVEQVCQMRKKLENIKRAGESFLDSESRKSLAGDSQVKAPIYYALRSDLKTEPGSPTSVAPAKFRQINDSLLSSFETMTT